jgi:hypothetical protein
VAAWRRPVVILSVVALCITWPATRAAAQHLGGHGGHGGYSHGGRGWHGGYSHGGYHQPGPVGYGHGHAYPGPFANVHAGYLYGRRYAPHVGFEFSIGSPLPPGYYYYDRYCDRRFGSLDLYYDHLYAYDHPWQVQVIGGDGGYPIASYRYRNSRWAGCN